MKIEQEKLRNALRDFRARSQAIDSAIDAGESAVEPAISLLNDRTEGVRWAAARILAEIGGERAVGPLIDMMERGRNVIEATEALRSITGKEFGEDPDAWRRWANKKTKSAGSETPAGLSDEQLLNAAVQDLPVTISLRGERQYEAVVALPGGRSQRVWVDFSQKDPEGEPIVQLCTACGETDKTKYEWALKLNMTIPYGAVAVAKMGDALCFSIVDSYLRRTAHPEEIAKSLMSLADKGDMIEKALAAEDRY